MTPSLGLTRSPGVLRRVQARGMLQLIAVLVLVIVLVDGLKL